MRWVVVVVVALFALGIAAAEDKLKLKDGQVVTGKILELTAADVQIKTADETMRVPRWAIDTIERADAEGKVEVIKADAAADRTAQRTGRPGRMPVRRQVEATPELLAWVDVCIKHIASSDAGVQAGAAAAIRSAGPAAKPALEKAASGKDAALAKVATRMLTQIDRVQARIVEQTEQRGAAGTTKPKLSETIAAKLEMNEEQATKYAAIHDDHRAKQEALTQSLRKREIEFSEAGKRAAELRAERDKQLSGVLSEEQMKKYLQLTPRPENRRAGKGS